MIEFKIKKLIENEAIKKVIKMVDIRAVLIIKVLLEEFTREDYKITKKYSTEFIQEIEALFSSDEVTFGYIDKVIHSALASELLSSKAFSRDKSLRFLKNALCTNKEEMERNGPPLKNKLEKIILEYSSNTQLQNELREFILMRNSKGNILTEHAFNILLKDLDSFIYELGYGTFSELHENILKMFIVRKTITKGWTSFYNLKPDEFIKASNYYQDSIVATQSDKELEKRLQEEFDSFTWLKDN